MTEQDLEGLGALVALAAINTEIQTYISTYGEEVPTDLIKVLSDLDWTVTNAYGRKRREVLRELKRRGGTPEPYRFPGTSLREQARRAWRRAWAVVADPAPPAGTAKRDGPPGEPLPSGFGNWREAADGEAAEPAPDLKLLDGWVWCEVHGRVHGDDVTSVMDSDLPCDAVNQHDLFLERRDGG